MADVLKRDGAIVADMVKRGAVLADTLVVVEGINRQSPIPRVIHS